MKKIILLLLVISATGTSAQQFNFKRYSLGIAAGVTHAYTDAPEMKIAPSLAFLFDYHITPFAAAYLDVQLGNIKGGSTEIDFVNVPNKHGREYSNTYTTATLNARLSLGQIIYYDETGFTNAIKGFYVGLGGGIIQNNVKNVRIQPRQPWHTADYVFPGADNSVNFVVPLNVGIHWEIKDYWNETRYIIGMNYQSNLTFGEGLDGYNDPKSIFKNDGVDIYNMGTISVKYCFGPSHGFYRP